MHQAGRDGQTALLVIDVQNAVVESAWDRDSVIERIAALIDRARAGGCPVIFVQHEEPEHPPMRHGAAGWQIVPELVPRPDEPRIDKRYLDAFVETDLAETLQALGVTHLVLTGAETDACIRAAFHRALVEGYDVTLVADCHTTSDRALDERTIPAEQIIAHTNLYAQYTSYPGQTVNVVPHEEVVFAADAAVAGDA